MRLDIFLGTQSDESMPSSEHLWALHNEDSSRKSGAVQAAGLHAVTGVAQQIMAGPHGGGAARDKCAVD